MSTPTTNYGFTKPTSTELVSTSLWNTNLDLIDTEVDDSLTATPEVWGRYFYEGNTTVTSGGTVTLFNTNWVQKDFTSDHLPDPFTFVDGELIIDWLNPALYHLYFRLTVSGILTSATEGGINVRLIKNSDGSVVRNHYEPLELFNGTQKLSVDWLLYATNDSANDLVIGETYFIRVAQSNSSGDSIDIQGAVNSPNTMVAIEMVGSP